MGANDPRGMASLDPQGHDWQGLCRGPLNIATHSIHKLWAPWFQRRRFFLSFSHYQSMGVNDPRGMASLDPRDMVGKIYVGDH